MICGKVTKMFKSKTVFILGAGASQEVGMPVGARLTGKIAQILRCEGTGAERRISHEHIQRALVCNLLRYLRYRRAVQQTTDENGRRPGQHREQSRPV